jgi:hypothetical protein
MAEQPEAHLPSGLAEEATVVTSAHGVGIDRTVDDPLAQAIDRVRHDAVFQERVTRLVERDRAILDRLAGRRTAR